MSTSFLPVTGVVAFCLSAAALAAGWLPTFSACRVLYRTHNPVLDSFQCHLYNALAMVFWASLIVGLVAICAALARQKAD